MSKRSEAVSLTKLYKSRAIRETVRTILTEDFEDAFDRLVKEGNNVRSLLIPIAISYKNSIKELVIEYGYEIETLEHLKICLDDIKSWDDMDECDSAVLMSQKCESV